MQAVFSYGGAMVYCEFMSEMRRPFDFWKALLVAEAFIFSVYIFFGVYVYSFQGQYVINPANQGMSMRGPLVAGNILYRA
jgi:amino acid permease